MKLKHELVMNTLMPFGKYHGKKISDIVLCDLKYLQLVMINNQTKKELCNRIVYIVDQVHKQQLLKQ